MNDHYFSADPTTASRPRRLTLSLPDVELELATDRGVFSPERVDPGTRFLLSAAPLPAGARTALDLGCGYGAIALTLATRLPEAIVWAVDVNERARHLCAANARAAGLANVQVATPEQVPPDVRYDLLWSNPPIRIGKVALHALLTTWLSRLTPGDGLAVLVVHKHLGADSLQRWLIDEGWPTDRVGSRAGYRLLAIHAGDRS